MTGLTGFTGVTDSRRASLARRAGRLPGPLRRAAVSVAAGADARRVGLLSVVVVVEPQDLLRLPEALDSLAVHAPAYREVLVVPLASASAPVGDVVAGLGDPRVRLLAPADDAAAAARAGLVAARGRWVHVRRGCDPLVAPGLRPLVEGLGESGSDLATGILRLPAGVPGHGQDRAHARPGPGLDLRGRPELVEALTPAGWVLGRDAAASLLEADLAADTWVLSPSLARLVEAAGAIDVHATPVGQHLAGHGRSPFGAAPSPWSGLEAWRRAVVAAEQAVPDLATRPAWRRCRLEGLTGLLLDAERATPQQWSEVVLLARQWVADADADLLTAPVRVLAWLAARDRRFELEDLAAELEELDAALPTAVRDQQVEASWSCLPADVPPEVRRLSAADVALRVRPVRRRGDLLDVHVALTGIDLGPDGPPVEVLAHGPATALVAAAADPAATRWAGSRFHDALLVTLRVRTDGLPGDEVGLELRGDGWSRSTTVPCADPSVRDPRADPEVVVHEVSVTATAVEVVLTGPGRRLRLVDAGGAEVAAAEELGPGRFGLPLTTRTFGRAHPSPTAALRLVVSGSGNPTLSEELRSRLPQEHLTAMHRVQVRIGPGGGLQVILGPPLDDDELGPRAQTRLQAAYTVSQARLDPGLVHLESYAGRSATDSPRAVHDELRRLRPDLRTVWGISDQAQWTPPGAERVVRHSRAWYDAWARAGAVVTNTDVEPGIVRRPGQVLVQTFHGYPSKGMGQAQWTAAGLPPRAVRRLRARGVETWSVIVTPTPEMTRHYREQYGYTGPALERGYPRDDALTAPGAAEVRESTRRLLGIGPDQQAVLYAPTWREHLAYRPRAAAMADHLDLARLVDALGPSYRLLVRGHRFHEQRLTGPWTDVTEHPEVNDLLLAADAAVLDYSSLRFDAALAGLPMVFLVPDLVEYAQGSRAFLFPFESTAPGPLVRETGEVVDLLLDLPGLARDWAAAREQLCTQFHPFQDGLAGRRVAAEVVRLLGALE